jgi:hypothetical protein
MKIVGVILLVANILLAGWLFVWPGDPEAPAARVVPRDLLLVDELAPARAEQPGVADPEICVEWRGLGPRESRTAGEQLRLLVQDKVMSVQEMPVDALIWLLYPPLETRQAAQAKLRELLGKGVRDVSVVGEPPYVNALSLGIYANGQSVSSRIRELEQKGVEGVKSVPRPRAGGQIYFVVRSEDAGALKELDSLRQRFPDSRLNRIDCPPRS